jgi:hypothetical protein
VNSIFTLSFDNDSSIYNTRYDLPERSEFRQCISLMSEKSEYRSFYVYNMKSDVISVRVKMCVNVSIKPFNEKLPIVDLLLRDKI